METTILPADSPDWLRFARQLLLEDRLVAFPTDTVYGVGALAFNSSAIDQLYQVKDRDTAKAIGVLVSGIPALRQVTGVMGPIAERLAQRFWPGPLTLVVSRHPDLPTNLSPLPTIGVRMPDHPVALELLESTGPLAVTSANLSGASNATTAQQVFDQLNGRIPLILDGGQTPGGQPSTVVDCTGEQLVILRQGPIVFDQLIAALA